MPARGREPLAPGVQVHAVGRGAVQQARRPQHGRLREVLGVHVDDRVVTDGRIDFLKLRPVGRLGYLDFVEVDNAFTMERPEWEG